MARAKVEKAPAEVVATAPQPENQTVSVQLSVDDWKNVLASMEVGIKAIGFTAFVSGGKLMEDIQQQLNEQMKPKT